MKIDLHAVVAGGLLVLAGACSSNAAEFESIFNGRSFEGWRHSDSHWTIEDGAITGEIPDGERLRRNLFLFWEEELHDFELRLEFRISGGPRANSGVQFRSQMLPGGGAAGYQADIDSGAVWLGRIYDEHGRALIGERGAETIIEADGKRTSAVFRRPASYVGVIRKGEWNEYTIHAVGPRMETRINGVPGCVLIDHQVGQHDFSGYLALQLHSGPGPAKIQFRHLRVKRLGKTEPPVRLAIPRARVRQGIVPTGPDGAPLNLGFEKGTLGGWKATGEAWAGQPIRGDTVTPRRPGQASQHAGKYWVGGYELHGDSPVGVLESRPFRVTHPFASFLVGGGPHHETRVEVVDAETRHVVHSASGSQVEDMRPVVVDLREHRGRSIVLRVVDEHRGAWGHVNYDDFLFHDRVPESLEVSSLPPRVSSNRLLDHLRRNPRASAPASDAERTVSNFYLPHGFRADLIAAEPDVRQPIAFALDERGRIWVAEAFSYPQKRPPGEGKDRVTIFEDADADGSFETRKVFAAGLDLISGLQVGFGGVWVAAAPELLFLPDADRDDVPDGEPVVLLDGWGYQDTHETPNSLTWGPDGWLYGNQGVFNRSRVGKPGTPDDERIELYACVWRYHPVRHRFEVFARGGSNQWGLDFNDLGELFMTHCRSYWGGGPTTHVVLRGHYWNQANSRHAPFISGSHPPSAPHLRNFLLASARYGHGEGGAGERGSRALYGGHSHVGTMIYLGDNWPDIYRDQLFTHNLHGHQINQQVNERRGAGYETRHFGRDFAYVHDEKYVAVDLTYGPDGSVYIIDWYDRQHCHSPHMERWDRSNGRIYRIAWQATFEPRRVDLGAASDLTLARLQTHKNDWYCRTARRILQHRAATREIDRTARAELVRLVRESKAPREVLRGAWTLHGCGELDGPLVDTLLAHSNEHVRAWGVRLATERRPARGTLFAKLHEMARTDESALVRLALASYLADAPAEQAWPLAGALCAHREDAGDRYLPRMIWYGIAPHVTDDLERAFALARATRQPVIRDFIHWHVAKTPAGLDRVVGLRGGADGGELRSGLEIILFALGLGGRREAPPSWERVAPRLYRHPDRDVRRISERLGGMFGDEAVLTRMHALLGDSAVDARRREEAFDLLAGVADVESVPAFLALLDEAEYRSRVISLLGRFDDRRIAPALVGRFGALSPGDRDRALTTLTTRAPFARQLLEAMVAGSVDRSVLTSFHVRQLRLLGDARVDELVGKIWGRARETSADARARIAAYRKLYREAPLWAYDAGSGKDVFEKTCANCHTLTGAGGDLGPSLAGAGRNGVDYFLENILDASAVVGEDYFQTVIVTNRGAVLTGLVRAETDATVTLRTVEETLVIEKSDIRQRQKLETSMMPDGLFDTLTRREVIELLKYLSSVR